MSNNQTSIAKDILTKVRERAADIHSRTGKSPLKLVFGDAEWEEYTDYAAKNWMVFPKRWMANYIAGIRILVEPNLPRGIYTEEEAKQAELYLSSKEGSMDSEATEKEGE